MAELDTQPAAWLQRAWTPRESFDPTPWLQERYNRQIQAQKLPLELQGMALQNQAHQLAIEHQGMMNDQVHQELQSYQEDLPVMQTAIAEAQKLPGGTLEMKSPSFKSRKAMDQWAQRQKLDAETAYGQAIHQRSIEDMKNATLVMEELGQDVPRNEDGSIHREMFASLIQQANEVREQRKMEEVNARTQWHLDLNKANADLNKMRVEEGLQLRRDEMENRKLYQQGIIENQRTANEFKFERLLQSDPQLKNLASRKSEAEAEARNFQYEHEDFMPGLTGFGRTKAKIAADLKTAQDEVKAINDHISRRERQLRMRFDSEARSEGPMEQEQDSGVPAAAPSAGFDFDYDPRAKKLVKPQ